MHCVSGKTVCDGIAIGPIHIIGMQSGSVNQRIETSVEEELEQFEQAILDATTQLELLYQKALSKVGKEEADIFKVHEMLIQDKDFTQEIYNRITEEKISAAYAVSKVGEEFAGMFEAMDDEYMRGRSADVLDVSKRLVRILTGQGYDAFELTVPSVIYAHNLTPSDTIQMDKSLILALVTETGSYYSHAAILARMMDIPAMIGVSFDGINLENGMQVIVDGEKGKVIINPDEACMEVGIEKMKNYAKEKENLKNMIGKENVTKSGRKIDVFANVSSMDDLPAVLENDAGGIGLFRTEFLYMSKDNLPDEDIQYATYKKVLEAMPGKKVVVRTIDLGADKQAKAISLDSEDNPAMGFRAIRICLEFPDLFKVQLRALLRAAVHGELFIMYPMIISVDEVKRIFDLVEEVKNELEQQGVSYRVPKQGVMIETPAAVMISDELAELVDFFSIGTNDLTQYTLAIDRQNEKLASFYNPHHKAILKMVQIVVENAHKNGIWVGVCGELGADLTMLETFISFGIDELSVVPSAVLKIRKKIGEADV